MSLSVGTSSTILTGWASRIVAVGAIGFFITGNMVSLRADGTEQTSPSSQEKIRAQIGSLPYLNGYHATPRQVGVTFHDKRHAYQGLNFYVSGGSPPIVLMDMKGNILHKWMINLHELGLKDSSLRRAHLFANGDILAILENKGLLKMDKDSKPIWFLRGRYHHDLAVAKNGDIYVLTRRDSKINVEDMDLKGPFVEDFITILSPGGKERKSISLLRCFLNSDYRSVLLRIGLEVYKGDNFHTNTLELIDGSANGNFYPFQKGCALISVRHLHTIAVVDLSEEKITWALSGMWAYQHQPTILPNGNILLFDNLGQEGRSKVIEFNPCTQKVVWAYRGDADNGFRTEDMGSEQRLPNGNTLITESRDGRAFEVTRNNTIVWDFFNPQQSGPEKKLIATIYELIRLKPEELSFLDDGRQKRFPSPSP